MKAAAILVSLLAIGGLGLLGLTGESGGQPPDADPGGSGPVVVELFTSQSCYSCPPAEALLRDLAEEDGVVALEWHVTYWNDLVYGRHGRWEDPYSDSAYTERQQRYNLNIRNRDQVYTPQIVVDGVIERAGNREGQVRRAIGTRKAARRDAAVTAIRSGKSVSVHIAGAEAGPDAEVYLVRFLKHQAIDVPRGENHGKRLVHANIVREVTRLGGYGGGAAQFTAAAPENPEEEGCAVLVQAAGQGPVLGAGYCS